MNTVSLCHNSILPRRMLLDRKEGGAQYVEIWVRVCVYVLCRGADNFAQVRLPVKPNWYMKLHVRGWFSVQRSASSYITYLRVHAVLRVQELVGQPAVDRTLHEAPGVVCAHAAVPDSGEWSQLVVVPYKREVSYSQGEKNGDGGLEDTCSFVHDDGIESYPRQFHPRGETERRSSLCDITLEPAEGALCTVDCGYEHHRRGQEAKARQELQPENNGLHQGAAVPEKCLEAVKGNKLAKHASLTAVPALQPLVVAGLEDGFKGKRPQPSCPSSFPELARLLAGSRGGK